MQSFIAGLGEKLRLAGNVFACVDESLDSILRGYFAAGAASAFPAKRPLVPGAALNLSRHGLVREHSMPINGDEFHSGILSSWRALFDREIVIHSD